MRDLKRRVREPAPVKRSDAARQAQRSGSSWEHAVIDLARWSGWRVASFRSVRVQRRDGSTYYATPVQADGEGFPDLVLARDERLLFRELKVGKAVLSLAQERWLRDLRDAGADVGVWRDTDIDAIVRDLRR